MKELFVGMIEIVITVISVALIVIAILTSDIVHVERTTTKPMMSIGGVSIEREVTIDYNKEAKNLVDDIIEWCNDTADSF